MPLLSTRGNAGNKIINITVAALTAKRKPSATTSYGKVRCGNGRTTPTAQPVQFRPTVTIYVVNYMK